MKATAVFLRQITVPENLNFDLEKSWKGPGKMHIKSVGTLKYENCLLLLPNLKEKQQQVDVTSGYAHIIPCKYFKIQQVAYIYITF